MRNAPPHELMIVCRSEWHGLAAALADETVWRDTPIRRHRMFRRTGWRHFLRPWSTDDTLVIPLRESDVRRLPRRYWGLHPTIAAVDTLRDKGAFAHYARRAGLAANIPVTVESLDAATFPAVIKRTNKFSSVGVTVAETRQAALELLGRRPWKNRPCIFQNLITGGEYVLHGVAVDGAIAWHQAYRYDMPDDVLIRRPDNILSHRPHQPTPGELALFERFLAPLNYSGPFNIDYRQPEGGEPIVLEINPRFGASIFWPENRADFAASMRTIIAHARPMQRPQ